MQFSLRQIICKVSGAVTIFFATHLVVTIKFWTTFFGILFQHVKTQLN